MSLNPSGKPVAGSCLACRYLLASTPYSYAFLAWGLSFGCAGSAVATVTNPTATAPKICLTLGILIDVTGLVYSKE